MTIKHTIECLYLDINDFVLHIDFALLYIFDPITQLYNIKWTCVEQKNLTSPHHKGVHYYVLLWRNAAEASIRWTLWVNSLEDEKQPCSHWEPLKHLNIKSQSAAMLRAWTLLRHPKCLCRVKNHVKKSPINPAFLHSRGPAALFPPSSFFSLSPDMICIRGQEVRDSATESDIWILCSQSQRVCTFPPNFSAAQRLRGETWTISVSISR